MSSSKRASLASFSRAEEVESSIRVAVQGGPGSGKSHFIQTIIDAGFQLYAFTSEASFWPGAMVFQGVDVADICGVLEEIRADKAMAALPIDKRPVIAVDSFTDTWLAQQEVAEQLGRTDRSGEKKATFQAWGTAKRPLKRLYTLLYNSPVHTVFTIRTKPGYEMDQETNKVKRILPQAIVEGGFLFTMDMILDLEVTVDPREREVTPNDFSAVVMKARNNTYNLGKRFPNPSFSNILNAIRVGAKRSDLRYSIEEQVNSATIVDWASMVDWATAKGIPIDGDNGIKVFLKRTFGGWDQSRIPEYIAAIEELVNATNTEDEG